MLLYVSDGSAFSKINLGSDWNIIDNKPLTFPPTKHNHPEIDPKIYATDFLQYCTANGNAILDLSDVGRVVFDGDVGESWGYWATYTNTCLFQFTMPAPFEYGFNDNAISNNFVQSATITTSEGFTTGIVGYTDRIFVCINKSSLIGWNEAWTTSEKVTAFKTWLASNNLVVYYKFSGVTPSYTFADLKTSLNYFSSNNLWLTSSWDWADKTNMPDQTDALFSGLEDDFYPAGVYSFGGGTTQHTHLQYEPVITKGTTAQYFKGDMSLETFPTQLPASDVSAWAKSSVKPTYNQDEVGDGTTYKRVTMAEKTNIVTAVNHAGAAHAPTDAQKNSEITQAEIEAKLTGTIDTHGHASAPKLLQGATSNEIRLNASTGLPEYYKESLGEAYDLFHEGNFAPNVNYTPAYAGIREVTSTPVNLTSADTNKVVYVSGAYTLNLTTVDVGEFAVGTQITVISKTTSTVTIDPASGVYNNGATANVTITLQYRAITLVMYATDYWFAIGVV